MIYTEFKYIHAAALEKLGFSMNDIVKVLEEAFRVKAHGGVIMPPKVFFYRDGDRFYSSMASASSHLGFGGCKWQSGDPENPTRGLPYIQGLYILTEDKTGQVRAVIDAEWITSQRTAAASALVVKYQAVPGAKTLGILGCGLQGRKHVEAIEAVRPELEECICFDIRPEAQEVFIAEMGQNHSMKMTGANSAEEVCRASEILITGGPIEVVRKPTIKPDWINPGCLVVTIDYDAYITDEAIADMDIVLSDDVGQIEEERRTNKKFLGVPRLDTTLADLVAFGKGKRVSDTQKILGLNLGIALEDLAFAIEILQRAEEQAIGITLPIGMRAEQSSAD
jgi:ornithine cyclodeaminase/alanine dehydrogenase-like protein (mu-crystallin family)